MVDNTNNMKEMIQEVQANMCNPELVQDDKLHFRIEKHIYRVGSPTQKDVTEANNLKNKMYFKLLQEKNDDGSVAHMMEKNLIKLLKELQDIDINAMSEEIDADEKKLVDIYLTLAKLKDTDAKSIDKCKKNINEIKEKRLLKVLSKAEYLAPSIQNQANDVYYKYLTAMCTEEYIELKDSGEWPHVWKNFDQYNKDNTNLPYIALGRLTELMLNV